MQMSDSQSHSRDEVVDKPSEADRGEANPIAADDEPVRNGGLDHRVTLETRGLLHLQPPDQHCQSGDHAEPKRHAPYSAQVVRAEAGRERSAMSVQGEYGGETNIQ